MAEQSKKGMFVAAKAFKSLFTFYCLSRLLVVPIVS
jgi:hypothetical protein